MSALLSQFQQARAAFEAAKSQLEVLKTNPELKRYQDFEAKLRNLMADFSMSLVDINTLLDPGYKPAKQKGAAPVEAPPKKKSKGGRPLKPGERKRAYKPRTTRTFTNPHTGQKLVYVGGVSKQLQEWRDKWGRDVVDTWGVLDEPAKKD